MSLMKCSTMKPGAKLRAMILRRQILQRPAARGSAPDRAQHRLQIQAGARGVHQALAHPDHRAGNDNLIAHLGVLSRPRSALVDDVLPHRLEQRPRTRDGGGIAAHHDGKSGVPRADVAAGDWRVDGGGALCRGRLGDLDGQPRLRRGHVDDEGAGSDGAEHAVGVEIHLADVRRETHHREDDIGAGRGGCRRVGPARAVGDQIVGFGPRPGVHRDRVAGGEQVPAHRPSHDSRADPGQCLRHDV